MNAHSPGDLSAGLEQAIVAGIRYVPERFLERSAAYVRGAQRADGGFAGRAGGSDLYYTSFALRAAELLSVDAEGFWPGAARFVKRSAPDVSDPVGCYCLVHAGGLLVRHGERPGPRLALRRMRDHILAVLESHHAEEGGFARTPGGPASLYHTYLASLCHRLLERPVPRLGAVLEMVRGRQQRGGGFSDLPAEGTGGLNPTAAAVQILSAHGALDDDVAERAAGFVLASARADGGFGPHPAGPVSDLLSTFSALVTLRELGALERLPAAPVARFAGSLGTAEGSFRGAADDTTADVEYTFYGLGTLGLAGLRAARAECGCGQGGAK